MRVLVVGGTGHIGSYLVPQLVALGHEVSVVARHTQPRYALAQLGWSRVRWVLADRVAEEASGEWTRRMQRLDADVVIDLVCFEVSQQEMMLVAFRGRVSHFLHCGTIWAYGPNHRVPTCESDGRRPITNYGRRKRDIEALLLDRWRHEGFPATVIHPGHISGRKWLPIDPQGSLDGVDVYRRLATGEAVVLPDQGLGTIHHVHADDVARLFIAAMQDRNQSLGESFSSVAPYAMTLNGCCEAVASMFGRDPNINYVPLETLDTHMDPRAAAVVREHVAHSPCCSTEKARSNLGFVPRYTTPQIYRECVEHLLETSQLHLL